MIHVSTILKCVAVVCVLVFVLLMVAAIIAGNAMDEVERIDDT